MFHPKWIFVGQFQPQQFRQTIGNEKSETPIVSSS